MQEKMFSELQIGDICSGFRLNKKEYVASKSANLYTLCHEKTKTRLFYFDRADENKTFTIGFRTLPENDTGVFHILEHSVLNGSKKFPVKEPFVSMLQSSMQTFLNALTYSDMTLYPVASRNEQDLFNLMEVYLDAVFCPLIYEKPEIFMQEGWHYEFGDSPCYNGVVFNEMKGVFADVESQMGEEMDRLLYPDNSYGFVSGGHPEHIPELSYDQFIATHRRFYHPSNACIFLDGHMDIDRMLSYIDEEYLCKYDYCAPDFAFKLQTPKVTQRTIYYEAQEGEENLAHMEVGKILCSHKETEKIFAAKILADYLTFSNEAPLSRAFLENNMAQAVSLHVDSGNFQPSISLMVRNIDPEWCGEIKPFLNDQIQRIIADGLDEKALMATLDHFAFYQKEISEPYGISLAEKVISSWNYGEDPMTALEISDVISDLREKVSTDYFVTLLKELLGNAEEMTCLIALPSRTKGQEDAKAENKRLSEVMEQWSKEQREQEETAFEKMQQWQQQPDSEEVLATLPHLSLKDVPEETVLAESCFSELLGVKVMETKTDTNGIVYFNLYFDLSDFSLEELRQLSILCSFMDELPTEHNSIADLQTKIRATCGRLRFTVTAYSRRDDLDHCTPYFMVTMSTLKENVPEALRLVEEILRHGCYDDAERIQENLLQIDYINKQAMISAGHSYAVIKALTATSKSDAMGELLAGESSIRWFTDFVQRFQAESKTYIGEFHRLIEKACGRNRMMIAFGGDLDVSLLSDLIYALPVTEMGECAVYPQFDNRDCAIEIPGDVGFCALGGNLRESGDHYTGSCEVLASMLTYGYLWNAVRVQGGAYGTAMTIRSDGAIYCYSYRDPNLEHTRMAFNGLADYLEEALQEDVPLDDLIIGTVNKTDPLLSPAETCSLACVRYFKGVTGEMINRIRREILHTTVDDLRQSIGALREFQANGKFCAVGNGESVRFIKQS